MRRGLSIFHLIDKFFIEKVYDTARNEEKKMNPNSFVAYYTLHTSLYLFVIFLIALSFGLFFQKFDTGIEIIPYICAAGIFLLMLYYASYRCHIDNEGITSVHLGFIKKHVSWKDIKKVESNTTQRLGRAFDRELVFRNNKNKIVFTCTYELAGFNLILKKINQYEITLQRKYNG